VRPGLVIAAVLASVAVLAMTQAAAVARVGRPIARKASSAVGCHAAAYNGTVPAAGPGLDTTSLGPTAPEAYEIGSPLSFPELFEPVKRVMILIHGGAWEVVGKRVMETERTVALGWRAAGWETVSITYQACGQSIPDVLRFYDLIRRNVGAHVPICIEGQSAGAHLALMIASLRAGVACVIAEGAPTDLRTMAAQGAHEAATHVSIARLRTGSALVAAIARAAFGTTRLAYASPVTHAASIHARLLLGRADDDWVIPREQAPELAAAVLRAHPNAYVDVDNLASGTVEWTHAPVSAAAASGFATRIARLVAPYGRAPTSGIVIPPLPPGLKNLPATATANDHRALQITEELSLTNM